MLGCYYLTKEKKGTKGEGRAFACPEDVLIALEHKEVETLTPIRLLYTGELIDLTTVYDDQDVMHTEPQVVKSQVINTTVGRVIFNDALPKATPYVNGLLRKKGLQQLVNYCYLRYGLEKTVHMLDAIKDLGFSYATRAGISIGIDDLIIPEGKEKMVARRAEGGDRGREAVPRRRDHQRRALQQGHLHLVGGHREGRRRDVQGDGEDRTRKASSSTRSTSWPTRARADRSSRSASSPGCAA